MCLIQNEVVKINFDILIYWKKYAVSAGNLSLGSLPNVDRITDHLDMTLLVNGGFKYTYLYNNSNNNNNNNKKVDFPPFLG